MPFHDITELPAGFCDPKTTSDRELSVEDRDELQAIRFAEIAVSDASTSQIASCFHTR